MRRRINKTHNQINNEIPILFFFYCHYIFIFLLCFYFLLQKNGRWYYCLVFGCVIVVCVWRYNKHFEICLVTGGTLKRMYIFFIQNTHTHILNFQCRHFTHWYGNNYFLFHMCMEALSSFYKLGWQDKETNQKKRTENNFIKYHERVKNGTRNVNWGSRREKKIELFWLRVQKLFYMEMTQSHNCSVKRPSIIWFICYGIETENWNWKWAEPNQWIYISIVDEQRNDQIIRIEMLLFVFLTFVHSWKYTHTIARWTLFEI